MRTLKLAAAVSATLLAAACASKKDAGPDPALAGAGAGGQGSGLTSGAVDSSPLGVQNQIRSVGDTVWFDLDSYDVRPDGAAVLRQQAQLLAANPGIMVRIEGHADERGTREYNIALGDRRANAVKDMLESYGVERGRITTISYGKDRPICGESDEGCYSQNRRATTTVMGAGS